MKSLRTMGLAVAAIALLAPASAKAEYQPGWYIGGDAMLPYQVTGDAKVAGVKEDVDYKAGWGLSASVGYGFDFGLRTEGELAYRHAAIDTIKGDGATNVVGGGIHNKALMANALYDINLGTRVTPYIGGGVGVSFVDSDNMRAINGLEVDDTKAAFAYQGIAGVEVALDGPWSLTGDYRYFATPDVKFKTDTDEKAKIQNASHNIVLGIRYTFMQPKAPVAKPLPPQPMPMPAPAPVVAPKAAAPVVAPIPQTYMVFFDWDKAVLTPEAKRIIASASADFKRGKNVRIVVTGHADTSGPKDYNMKLSQRRADAVKKEFVAQGVAPDALMTRGAGENELRVPTADSVREAQNRRAEIVFK